MTMKTVLMKFPVTKNNVEEDKVVDNRVEGKRLRFLYVFISPTLKKEKYRVVRVRALALLCC